MRIKFVFTSTVATIVSSILSAQSTLAFQQEHLEDSYIRTTVRHLEQNALWVLVAAVTLIGMIWTCSVLRACADLNKPKKISRNPYLTLLALVTGVSIFCSSCTIRQPTVALRYRILEEAGHRIQPCQHEYRHPMNLPFNNRYASNGYSNLHGPALCKYCGQVDFSSYH